MRSVVAVRWASIGSALFLSSAAPALAQNMPGIETKRVKTIPIRPDGSPRQTFTPGARSTMPPPAVDGPTVKVPTIRVSPTGEMTYPPPRDPADDPKRGNNKQR